jgi:L-lactate dehydrogenase complex protein LldG
LEREAFLQRVRQAVRQGKSGSACGELPVPGTVGYQGAGPDLVGAFCRELTAAGGQAHVVPDQVALAEQVVALATACPGKRVLLGQGELLAKLDLAERLSALGKEVWQVSGWSAASKECFFAADLGISQARWLVAETGSVVLAAGPQEPRSLSLLPPVHLVVAEHTCLVPDLFDLFRLLASAQPLPSCLTLITGPSKTGDIELRLVTGVHGPGEVHVVLWAPPGGAALAAVAP